MAHVAIQGERVEIRLSLVEEVLSLHGALHVPLRHVRGVSADPVPAAWWRGVKIGTQLPGVVVAGTFLTGEGAIFYDFRDARRCVTLELRDERYRRVVVQVDPPQEPAQVKAELDAALAAQSNG